MSQASPLGLCDLPEVRECRSGEVWVEGELHTYDGAAKYRGRFATRHTATSVAEHPTLFLYAVALGDLREVSP
jgi:hypothetical protein